MIIFIKKSNILLYSLSVIFIVGLTVLSLNYKKIGTLKSTYALSISGKTVVLDAGHGGFDPGKVGVLGTYEKEINLEITKKLQTYLENSGAFVILTRADENGLASDDELGKKKKDLKARQEIINEKFGDVAVSIHQNSFTSSAEKGSQVFYYTKSEESKKLAQNIDKELKSFLDKTNRRQIKSDDTYYIFKTTTIPTVIVECGFLSNHEENSRLITESYQERVAYAIYIGIINYFEENKKSN